MRLYRLTLVAPWRTGPVTVRRLLALTGFVPLFLALQTLHWVCFLLDDLLFPSYRRVEVREPLFVVGMPRSGTTFLHHVLARDEGRFTTPRLWELVLAPSIVQRKVVDVLARVDGWIGGPLRRILERVERAVFRQLDEVHPVTLASPEEDYFALLPAFACFLLVVPFPTHPAVWRLARFDELPVAERRRILGYYRGFLQRHLYLRGGPRGELQVLSKNPSFSPMIASLREEFPDARIVFCVRDPVKAAPSLISSLRSGSELFGYDVTDPAIRDRFLDMLEYYTEHALDVLPDAPRDRQSLLRMREVTRDVRTAVAELYDRFGWELGRSFQAALEDEHERSRRYRSGHSYTMAEVGLDPDEVRSRFGRLIQHFEYDVGSTPVPS